MSPIARLSRAAFGGLFLLATLGPRQDAGSAPAAAPESVAGGLVVKQGHSGYVSSVAFTTGGTLVSASATHPEILHWSPEKLSLTHGLFTTPTVRGAELSPLGSWLAVVGDAKRQPNNLALFDARTGAEVARMQGPAASYREVVISAGEDRLAAVHPLAPGTGNSEILVWNARTGLLLFTLPMGKVPVHSLALSSDGDRLAAVTGDERAQEVRLWSLRTGLAEPPVAAAARQVSFSPDGKHLAVAARDLKLWDLDQRTSRVLLAGDDLALVVSAEFSPDGKDLAVVVGYPTRRVSQGLHVVSVVPGGKDRPGLSTFHSHLTRPAFSPDGKWFAVGHGPQVLLLDRATGGQVAALGATEKPVRAADFSPDGKTLVTGADDHRIRFWDPATGLLRKTLTAGGQALAFSRDGRWLASGGIKTHLYDVRAGKLLPPIESTYGSNDEVAFSPDGKWLVTGGPYAAPQLWDVATRKPGPALDGRSAGLAFSPGGETLVAGGLAGTGSVLQIWNTRTWKSLKQIPAHEGARLALAFSPDGKTLVSGGDYNRALRAWNTADWSPLHPAEAPSGSIRAIRFLPDGKTAAVLDSQYDSEVSLWEPRAGLKKRTLIVRKELDVRAMDLSPDGKQWVLGAVDGSVSLHDGPTGRLRLTMRTFSLPGATAAPAWLAYTPDGYFTGSPGVEPFLFWLVGGRLRNSPTLIAHHRRPDRVRAALRQPQ